MYFHDRQPQIQGVSVSPWLVNKLGYGVRCLFEGSMPFFGSHMAFFWSGEGSYKGMQNWGHCSSYKKSQGRKCAQSSLGQQGGFGVT